MKLPIFEWYREEKIIHKPRYQSLDSTNKKELAKSAQNYECMWILQKKKQLLNGLVKQWMFEKNDMIWETFSDFSIRTLLVLRTGNREPESGNEIQRLST